MKESENIIRIFEEVRVAVEKRDTYKLKQLSDQTNNTASRTQDPDNIAVAVIIYSLGKILERGYENEKKWSRFYKNILVYIDKEIAALKKGDARGITETLKSMRGEIENLSGKMKAYISDVFRKASINKASKIYEHGVSMESTSNLLGITPWELASYAGEKQIEEIPEGVLGARQRIKIAEGIFG